MGITVGGSPRPDDVDAQQRWLSASGENQAATISDAARGPRGHGKLRQLDTTVLLGKVSDMNIKNGFGRVAGIAAAAAAIGGLSSTGVASASTAQPAVTLEAHGSATAAAAAFIPCYNGEDPNNFDPAGNITPIPQVAPPSNPVELYGRVITLRYNSNRCAWGKIDNGSQRDEVWVDRSSNGGAKWDGKLGDTIIHSGLDNHTVAYNDANTVMRACGKAWNRPEIACTGWY